MTKSQMALVLAKAGTFDQRTVGDADIESWYECMGHMDFNRAMEAVTVHYRASAERLMPYHLEHPDPTVRPNEDWQL